jgi:hypothetical protein
LKLSYKLVKLERRLEALNTVMYDVSRSQLMELIDVWVRMEKIIRRSQALRLSLE